MPRSPRAILNSKERNMLQTSSWIYIIIREIRPFVYIPLSCERWEKLGKGLEYEIFGSVSFYLVECQSALKRERDFFFPSKKSPFELAVSGDGK